VPGLPLPCCVRRSWPTFSLTPDLLSAAGAVAASAGRGAGRLHPTSIGTPAVVAPKNGGGCAEASRSSAGPDTRTFPAPRPFKASGSSLRGGRPVLPGSRPGQVVRGRSHGGRLRHTPLGPPQSLCCANGARPAAHPGVGLPGFPPMTHEADSCDPCWCVRRRAGWPQWLPFGRSSPAAPVAQWRRNLSMSKTLFVRSMWYMARPNLWDRTPSALPVP
jgi:hypothetical protein